MPGKLWIDQIIKEQTAVLQRAEAQSRLRPRHGVVSRTVAASRIPGWRQMVAVMTVRQLIGACVLLVMISAPALPQTPTVSFEQLIAEGAIQPHQTVYVTDAWGERVKGRLAELRPGSLVLIQGSQKIQITEADVDRIQRGDSIQNGLWLGLGAGIAAASIAPHLACDLPDDECANIVFAAIGLPSIAAGMVAGALVDAAIKKTVFQFARPRGSARMQVSPVLGGRRVGALATIRF
jgi:hypothetical protein